MPALQHVFQRPTGRDRSGQQTEVDHVENRSLSGAARAVSLTCMRSAWGPGIRLVDVVICGRPSRRCLGGPVLVQRVVMPASQRESWTVLGEDAVPVGPVERYLAYLTDIERSPNTVKAYAHDLKDWFVFLGGRGRDWREVRLEDVGEFVAWLRLRPSLPGPRRAAGNARTAWGRCRRRRAIPSPRRRRREPASRPRWCSCPSRRARRPRSVAGCTPGAARHAAACAPRSAAGGSA